MDQCCNNGSENAGSGKGKNIIDVDDMQNSESNMDPENAEEGLVVLD